MHGIRKRATLLCERDLFCCAKRCYVRAIGAGSIACVAFKMARAVDLSSRTCRKPATSRLRSDTDYVKSDDWGKIPRESGIRRRPDCEDRSIDR